MPRVSLLFFLVAIAFPIWAGRSSHSPNDAPKFAEHDAESSSTTRAARIAMMLESSSTTPDLSFTYNALDPTFQSAALQDSLFNPADDYWGLPRDPGYEEVAAYCSACHSLRIVMQQRATPARWRELLVWMVEKQGMAPLDPDQRKLVQDYLGTHFSSDTGKE